MTFPIQRFLSFAACILLGVAAAIPAHGQMGMGEATMSVEAMTEYDGVHPGATFRAMADVEVEEGWHVNSNEPLEDFLIPTEIVFEPPEGFEVTAIFYPEAEHMEFEFWDTPLAVYERQFVAGVELSVSEGVEPGDYEIPGIIHYQACDDSQCLPPNEEAFTLPVTVVEDGAEVTPQAEALAAEVDWDAEGVAMAEEVDAPEAVEVDDVEDWEDLLPQFEVLGEGGGYMPRDEFLSWLDEVEAGEARTAMGILEGQGLIAIVLLTLAGGFLLNLTPCVLPVIPINLAIIGAGAKASSKGRGVLLGSVFGGAMALVYGGLGFLVVTTAATFGAINASPWFNLAIAVVFVVLGLAMFDFLKIDFSKWRTKFGIQPKEGGSVLVAFGMGALVALLAGACVAPIVIAVILFSQTMYAEGVTVALFLPFLLGLGMGLPWAFAGGGLSFLPKPGPWMVYVNYTLGVIILIVAAYFGYKFWTLFDDQYLVDHEEVVASVEAMEEEGWHTSLAAGLEESLETGKPVFIDFWATWCSNCLYMNQTTFQEEAVLERLDDYVLVKYQAEQPGQSPHRELLDHFNYVGLPLYVVLTPPGYGEEEPEEEATG